MKTLLVYPERCTGCKNCMLACSFAKEGVGVHAKSRVGVTAFEELGIHVAIPCFHCQKAPCAYSCPTRAMERDSSTDAVVINEGRCIGCRVCMMTCPFGAIHFGEEKRKVYKCDLCGGDPACVKWCDTYAIVYRDLNKAANEKWVKAGEQIVSSIKLSEALRYSS